jgi:hypothetical protein
MSDVHAGMLRAVAGHAAWEWANGESGRINGGCAA